METAMVRVLGLAAAGLLAACAVDASATGGSNGPKTGDKAEDGAGGSSSETPSGAAPRTGGPRLGLDAKGCLDVGSVQAKPVALTGRLIVTYVDPTLEAEHCELDEATSKYWCRSATATSTECAADGDAYWCPTASPTAAQLGDPQELASFDLANPSAGPVRWTNNDVHEAEIDVSPDGSKVVYAVRKHLDDFANGLGIWVSDSDGQNAHEVVDQPGFTGIPTWVPPSNDKFTFIDDSGFHLFDMGAGQKHDVVIDGFDSGLLVDPAASHDGKHVVFKADEKGGEAFSIYVMDFDPATAKGADVRRVTQGFSDHDPVFTADDGKVLFERYYGPGDWNQDVDKLEHPEVIQWGIVSRDLASGEEIEAIPHDPCGKHYWWLPTLSPDGQSMMFIHDVVAEDGYQDLWVSDLDGGNAQPVPNTRSLYWFAWTR